MSYSLEKDEEILVEKWMPYKPLSFEMDEMRFRHDQLNIRTGECSKTLDLLSKLNEGCEMGNILQPAMDVALFKVRTAE